MKFIPAFALIPLLLAGPATAAECSARSGPERATLVELFTSEGCDSCPPADRWLAHLLRTTPDSAVVALAYHVDYWDRLGWRDRFASPASTARQEARRQAARQTFLYTPQVSIDGSDFRAWRSRADLREYTAAPRPARASIALGINIPAAGILKVRVEASTAVSGSPAEAATLYLALVEDGLVSEVSAGENAGRRLEHDAVVREWIGPLAADRHGRIDASREFRRPDVDFRKASVVALVESPVRLEPLQALKLRLCP